MTDSKRHPDNAISTRPIVVVSRCLGFEACRWNGQCLRDAFVDSLRQEVDFVTVCPECDMGLGVPRDPVRLVDAAETEEIRLVQPATGRDVTEAMQRTVEAFLSDLQTVDGFLLKYRSPSCGPGNVKVYRDAEGHAAFRRGAGFFATRMRERFPDRPIEDEGRLHHFRLREHWLIGVFAGARLRGVESSGAMGDLVDFHARHKYLLLAYHEEGMRLLGRIVAAGSRKTARETIGAYAGQFRRLFDRPASTPAVINVLQHIFGHFTKELQPRERHYFLNVLEEYRHGGLPLSVPIELLKSWAIRFDNQYILDQAFLHPYPEALVMISDSGKGREL